MQRETIIARDTLKRLLAKVLFVLVQALQDQVNGGGSQGLHRSANRSTGTGRAGKYVGDIGDYAKFRLLRALLCDRRLGLSWYLFPDEGNNDGRHIDYLDPPTKWRCFDEQTFDTLKDISQYGQTLRIRDRTNGLAARRYSVLELQVSFLGMRAL